MVKNLVARRYGSLHDFSKVVARWCEISKATGMHRDTIRMAVLLYHKRGNRFFKCNSTNFAMGRPRTVPQDVEALLTSKKTLYEMRFLSLARRTELIRREQGIELAPRTLATMYKRNGVKYLQAKKAKRLSSAHEFRIEQERIAFARKLDGLLREDPAQVVYMDQTTFQIWPKPTKTW